MAKKNRTWIKLDGQTIMPPTLDENLLPIEETLPLDEDILELNTGRGKQSYFDIDYSKSTSRRLEGTGQPIYDEEGVLAANQSFISKVASGVVSRGTSIFPKIGQNVAHMAGAINYGVDYMFEAAKFLTTEEGTKFEPDVDPAMIWDNQLAETFKIVDDKLLEELPVYKHHYERYGSLKDQMRGTAFWANDLLDGIAFLGMAYVTGAGIGAASKGMLFSKAFLATTKGKQAVQSVKTISATVLNAMGESGFETKDYNDSQRDFISYREYGEAYKQLPEDLQKEIKEQVAPGAARVYRGNLGVLILPNYVQSRFMYGSAGRAAKGVRNAVRSGKMTASDIKVWKEGLKGGGLSALTEGLWEEGMQHSLQTYNERKISSNQDWGDYMNGLANQWVDNWATTEGQKSMMLGALIGLGFGGIGGVGQAMAKKKFISEEEKIWDDLTKILDINNQWYTEHISAPFQKHKNKKTVNGETIEIEGYYDENGEVTTDPEKLRRMFLYMVNNKFLYDEAMAAAVNGDDIHLKAVNNDALARLYYRYATSPGITNLDEVDELLLKRELQVPVELQDEGITQQFTKESLAPFREAYEEAETALMDLDDFTENKDDRFWKDVVQKTLFGEKMKRDFLNDLKLDENISKETSEQIDRLLKDSSQRTKLLLRKDTREKLKKEYQKEISSQEEALLKQKAIFNKEIDTEEERIRAQYEIDEFFDINGKSTPFSTEWIYDYDITYDNALGMSRPFGTKYNYFKELGDQYSKKATIRDELDKTKSGRASISVPLKMAEQAGISGVMFSEEEVLEMETAVGERDKNLSRAEKKVAEREAFNESYPEEITEAFINEQGFPEGRQIPNPAITPEIQAAIDRNSKYLDAYQKRVADQILAKEALNALREMTKANDEKVSRNKIKTHRRFQRKFADYPVKRAINLANTFKSNKSFDDANIVGSTLRELKNRKRIYAMPGRKMMLTTNEFKGYIESVNDVITELEEIRPKVEENFENRKTIDRRSMVNYSRALFSALGIKIEEGIFKIIDSDIYKLISDIIGEDILTSILNDAATIKSEEYNFTGDSIFAEKIIDLVKKSGKKNKLIENIDEKLKILHEQFNKAFEKLPSNDPSGVNTQLSLAGYEHNPFKAIDHIIGILFDRYSTELDEASILDLFMRNKDPLALYEAIINGSDLGYKNITPEELLTILEPHIKITGLTRIKDRLKSKKNIADVIAVEASVAKSKKHAPSNQQLIALREAVFQLEESLSKRHIKYHGWYYIKGLAGTGKTQLMALYFPELIGLTYDNIIALSTHENALKVLQSTLDGVKNTGLAQDITQEQLQNEKIELVIVDEVSKLSSEELGQLADKITEANVKRHENEFKDLKVVVLGDPAQVLNKESESAPINRIVGAILNIKELSPLTTVFRSGNTAIIRAQNMFIDFPGKVKNFIGMASENIGLPAIGVHVSNSVVDLTTQLAIHKKVNKRSRAVVVGNEEQKKQYKQKGVDVFLPHEISSLEYDEVYIDINPKEYDKVRKYNDAMYTSISRAMAYTFIVSYEQGDSWGYETGKIEQEDVDQRAAEVRADYTARLELEVSVLGDELKAAGIKQSQIFNNTPEEEEQVTEKQTDQSDNDGDPVSSKNVDDIGGKFADSEQVKSGQVHELEFPSYDPIKNQGKFEDTKPFVREGSRVKYIHVLNPKTKLHEIHIVAQHINIDGTPLIGDVWSLIGVMSQNEFDNTKIGKKLLLKSAEKKTTDGYLSKGKYGTIKPASTGNHVLAEGVIKKASSLSYIYGDDISRSGIGFIAGLKKKVQEVFKGEKLTFKVKIYTTSDNRLTAGIPYLEIIREHTNQFIRLTGRRMRRDDQHMVAIDKFRSVMKQVEDAGIGKLGDPYVNELLKRFRKNFEVQNEEIVRKEKDGYTYEVYTKEAKERQFPKITEEQFNLLNELSKDYIPSFYKSGEVNKKFDTEQEYKTWLKSGPELDKDNSYEWEEKTGYIKGTSTRNPDQTKYLREMGLKAEDGPLQIRLNVIAKTNPKSSFAITKRISIERNGKITVKYITKAKSIFSEKSTSGVYYQHLLAIYKSIKEEATKEGLEDLMPVKLSDFLKDSKKYTEEDNLTFLEDILLQYKNKAGTTVKGISATEFREEREKHQSDPITMETLDEILSFDENGINNNLYYPLLLPWVNKLGEDLGTNEGELEQVLGSRLKDINRTRIQVELDPGTIDISEEGVPEKAPGKKVKDKVGEGVKKIRRRWDKPDKKRLTPKRAGNDPGEVVTIEQALEMAHRWLPSLKDDKDSLQFVEKMIIDALSGESSYGLYQDQVAYVMSKDGKTFVKPLRHEIFHKIFNEFLTGKEQLAFEKAFKEQFPQYKNKSLEEIEELANEKWHDHTRKPIKGLNKVIMDFFNMLSKVFGFMNMNVKNLDRLFETIESGHFVKSKNDATGIKRKMRDLVKDFGNGTDTFKGALENYKKSKNIILTAVNEIQRDGYQYEEDGKLYPVSISELDFIVRQELENLYKGLLSDLKEYDVGVDILTKAEYLRGNEKKVTYSLALKNFDSLWKSLFQNYKITTPVELRIDESMTEEEIIQEYKEGDNKTNLIDHIRNSDEVNQEDKISLLVKDFLSNISLNDEAYMKWREAYIRTLQVLEGVQLNEDFIIQIDQMVKKLGNNPRVKIVADNLKEMYQEIVRPPKNSKNESLSNTAKFVTEDIFVKDEESVKDIHGKHSAEVLNIIPINRKNKETTIAFIDRISEETEIPVDDVISYFNHNQKLRKFKAINNLLNNQNQKDFFVVERKNESGGLFSISYIPASTYGVRTTIKSQIEEALRNKISNRDELDEFLNKWLDRNRKQLAGNRYTFVKSFLKHIGLGHLAPTLPDVASDELYNSIIGFFDRANKEMGTIKKTEEHLFGVVIKEEFEIGLDYLISKDPKFINLLSTIIGSSSSYMRATNIKTGDGKKRYLWSTSSFMNTVFTHLMNNSSKIYSKVKSVLPKYLEADYFKKNPFISGQSRISAIINNDGIKKISDRSFSESFTSYKNENRKDYITRTFIAGFMDRIRRSKDVDVRYFQWLYPNERTQAVAAEVGVKTKDQVRDYIKIAIEQINESEKFDSIKQTESKRFINMRLLEEALGKRNITTKKLSPKEIDKYTDKVIELLAREADEFAQSVIDNKVPFDSLAGHIGNLRKFLSKEEVNMLKGEDDLVITTANKEYNILKENILPLVELYVMNDYVNSYFLNQLILGDNNQFENEEDVMRRHSLATAPGSIPIVNETFGIKEKVKFVVLGNSIKSIDDIKNRLLPLLTDAEKEKLPALLDKFTDNFDSTDGQGFMTPERFEELENAGFTEDFGINEVLKPVVYSINDNGVVTGLKFSSIVLTDELVEEFPSLGVLRYNLRKKKGVDEAIFASGVKLGMPQATASYPEILTGEYEIMDTMTIDVFNRDYRLQLDPKSKIKSRTTQPSQLIYLMSVLDQNIDRAKRAYNALAKISNLEGETFLSRFKNKKTFRDALSNLLEGRGNERMSDLFKSGISHNFPNITDKLVIQMANRLSDSIVHIKFPGNKLVLQSETGVRKYGKSIIDEGAQKLAYKLDDQGNLVAEVILPSGILPREYEDRIKAAIAQGKDAHDFYDLPDLLGFRIPSSDIHSGVAMKVVGFYSTPDINVVIAPDLLVALHGSDFDVDSLFLINRYHYPKGHENQYEPIGYYKGKNGRWEFNEKKEEFDTREEEIKYYKNTVVHELLDLISNPKNKIDMLSPIPMNPIYKEKDRAEGLTKEQVTFDLSNTNHKLEAHDVIFGAATATGVFGNAAKAFAYLLRTNSKGTMPELKEDVSGIVVNDHEFRKIQLYDGIKEDGENLFTSIDGFINAAIDNIRVLALHSLNITSETIDAFITMRGLGVPLETVDNILLQPSIRDYSKIGSLEKVREHIMYKLGKTDVDTDEIELNDDNLSIKIKKYNSISDIPDGNLKELTFQLRVIEEFAKAKAIGDQISNMSKWLKIARTLPVTKVEIDDSIESAIKLFGEVSVDGKIPDQISSEFPFLIPEFFEKNMHILSFFNKLREVNGLIEQKFLKYSPEFNSHVEKALALFSKISTIREDKGEFMRNELLTYLIANEIYSGEYSLERDVEYQYKIGNDIITITGPKAINQIFIKKIFALTDYMGKQTAKTGKEINNQFLDHISPVYNIITKTYELRFDGGSHLDTDDQLDFQSAFLELNKYEVNYNKKTGAYTVVERKGEIADNNYSNFQKEFVSYGVMNWGLQFGSSNYSSILPGEMYAEVDGLFNEILENATSAASDIFWDNIQDDFAIQFVINHGRRLQDHFFFTGKPVKQGDMYIGNDRIDFYGGRTDSFFYDRSYSNPDGKVHDKYIVTRSFKGGYQAFIRMNGETADTVYYQRIGRVNPFKFYNTSDEVLTKGYIVEDHFGGLTYNHTVNDLNSKMFEYHGSDLKVGDDITFTQHHDVTRVDKAYKKITKIEGTNVTVKDSKITEVKKADLKPKSSIINEKQSVNKASAELITGENGKVYQILDRIINSIPSGIRKKALETLRDEILKRDIKIIRQDLDGSWARFYPDGTVAIDINKIVEEIKDDVVQHTDTAFTHELFHSVTLINYLTDKDFKGKIDSIIKQHFTVDKKGVLRFKNESDFNAVKEVYKRHGFIVKKEDDIYGLTDIIEFMSEIFNDGKFSEAMDAIYESSEQKSALRRIIDAILEFFGWKNSEEFKISDHLLGLVKEQVQRPDLIRVSKDLYKDAAGNYYNLKSINYVDIEVETEPEAKEEVKDKTREKIMNTANNIKEHSEKVHVEKLENGLEGNSYIIKATADRIRRITDRKGGMISFFSNKVIDPLVSWAQNLADMKWQDTEKEHKFRTDEGKMEDYNEFKTRKESELKFGEIKGKIVHLNFVKVANKLFNLRLNNDDITKEINDLASLSENQISPSNYDWVFDPATLQKIFKNAGINVLMEDIPETLKDMAYLPEQIVWNEKLGFGGSVDALIGHADNTWSIIDWKTGRNFGKRTSTEPLKYGQQEVFITDNQREHAKLQVMMYAVMLKLNNKEMKFRDLMVMWVPDDWMAERVDNERFVEVRAYLRMVESFFNDKKALKEAGIDPNIKDYMLENSPDIFNPTHYTAKSSDSLTKELIDNEFTPEEAYRRKVLEMTIILSRFKEQRQVRHDELRDDELERLKVLYEEIAIMRSDPGLQIDVSSSQDIGVFTEWFGNYNDISMDVFQTWVKIRNENWNKYTQQHDREVNKINELLKPIYARYMKGKVKFTRGGIDRLALVNYAELFSFAFKEVELDGYARERLLTDEDEEWNNLRDDEKAFLNFVNNKFQQWYIGEKAYLNQTATEMGGKKYSWLELYNINRSEEKKMKYYDGWFPKIMKTQEEVNYEQGARVLGQQIGAGDITGANIIGKFSRQSIRGRIKRALTWYEENTFEGFDDRRMSLPIKFQDSHYILNSRDYSKNVLFMFDKFNKSMLHKSHMDKVYATGQGLKAYLQLKKYGNGQPMFENTIRFLDKKMISDLQNVTIPIKYSSKPITFGKKNISPDKIIMQLINWTSATIMWLKPFQGTGNGLHAKLLTYREGLKGTIASKFLNIEGDAIDFRVEDNAFADTQYFGDFTKDALFGDLNKNKMWLLARKLNYIPDNYDYATNKRFLLSTRNVLINRSNMYMFHSKPEEYVSLTTMTAQLNYLKNPVTGKSLWDSYQVEKQEDGTYDVVWKGGVRGFEREGKGIASRDIPITELTSHEISKLKRVHERMQGGYRKEEAANIEVYVMGKAFIQFKKYLPRLIINALSSKRAEVSLGTYRELSEKRIWTDPETGEKTELDVYEWIRRTNEGRWRTTVNWILASTNMSKNREYKWSQLESEQKQNVVDFMLGISIWGLFSALYAVMFADDDDDDTFKKWWRNYMILNLSQQYNPYELLHTVETAMRPVSFSRAFKATEAIRNMMIATGNLMIGNTDKALTTSGELQGWNEFMRSVPYLASWHDFANKMKHGDTTEEWWTSTWDYKWR